MHARTVAGERSRRPSPPWFGGLAVALVWVIAIVLLSYTLLDLPWQQAVGAWNYWFCGASTVAVAVLFRSWRADERR